MFYKVICLVNTYVFCATMMRVNRFLKPVKVDKVENNKATEVDNQSHKAFLNSLHF